MQFLFIIIPVALLSLVALIKLGQVKMGLTLSPLAAVAKSDQRGITLQTVIITAVLALAAAGAGIVIYNVVDNEAGKASTNASQACDLTRGATNSSVNLTLTGAAATTFPACAT